MRVLVDATRTQMMQALTDMRRNLGERDNLVIYYAGHGHLDREADRGYWLAVDAERDNPANWVSNADITDALRAMRAKHVLIVADSCYSGTLMRDLALRAPEASDLAKLAQRRARSVLTSGALEPVTDVGGGGHSVFARAFLAALRANTTVTDVTSLFVTLRKQVMLGAEQTPQYGDVRLAGHDGGEFIFARPGASLAATPPAAPPRREPTITKEEVVPAYGSVAIRGSLAGIEVWLADRKIGETEQGSALLVSNLATGTYRIKARKADHKAWERDIRVVANQRTDVLIDLELLGPAKVIKGDDGAEMVLVPAGEFWMGSDQAEIDRYIEGCKKAGVPESSCKPGGAREAP
ncbi:MAG: caspase family protein, partial [Candidatus Rokubacteria bacterium]|nr:caspase family protein [Candidatus Rokubacteria bacterium]